MIEKRLCATCAHSALKPYESPCDGWHPSQIGREARPNWVPRVAGAPTLAPTDAVNPAHYRQFPVEVIQLARHLNFNRGNAVKYLCRAGKKDDEVQDLKKARWYIDDEIQRLTGEGEHAKP